MTPAGVQRWLHTLPYNHERGGRTLRTLPGVLKQGSAHCLEAALAAATLLEPHGYPPLLLDMESADRLDHVVFAFQHRCRWGAVGASRDDGLWGRKPVYPSPCALARSYYAPYITERARVEAWALADLRDLTGCDWRASPRNVWTVERWLTVMPHRPLRTSDQHHERLRATYRRFRAQGGRPHETPFRTHAVHWT
ncbi:MAG: hypothetical protein WD934_10680 [Gemmatimonadales bacterium]